MTPDDRIFVAGHRGLAGSAIVRRLRSEGFPNLLLKDRSELDLTERGAVDAFFVKARPHYVFLAAAKVGGILANREYPVQFLFDNLAMQMNVIDAAYRNDTKKLLFIGSSCIYPRLAPQPMPEECLLTGLPEPTNEGYSIAKIAGIKLCQAYRRQYGFDVICAIPTNLYGPGDNFSLASGHVLPALLRKFLDGKKRGDDEVEIWGTGKPRREFMHSDDLADACLYLMQRYDSEHLINVGWGVDVSICELAEIIARITQFEGRLRFDATKPDGSPRKLLDTTRLRAFGWAPRIDLQTGIRSTYAWLRENYATVRL